MAAAAWVPVFAAPPPSDPASREAVQYLEKRLDDQKAEQDKMEKRLLEAMQRLDGDTGKAIAAQDKRVSDLQVMLAQQGNFAAWLGVFTAIMGLVLVVGGAVAGYMGYKRLESEARAAVENGRMKFESEIGKIRSEMLGYLAQTKNHAEESGKFKIQVQETAEEIAHTKEVAEAIIEKMRRTSSGTLDKPAGMDSLQDKERRAIENEDAALKSKPEKDLNYQEWMAKGSIAQFNKDYAASASSFERAAEIESPPPPQVAEAIVNAGNAYYWLGALDKAIACYDKVEKRFKDAPKNGLREPVAKVLFNKWVVLNRQGKPQEAIACYDEVEKRFKDAPETGLKEQVAKALVGKGVVLDQQGKPQEAIACFNEVEKRFNNAPESGLREMVASALFNKGVVRGRQGQPVSEIACYDEVEKRFKDAPESGLRKQVAKALNCKNFVLLTELKKRWGQESPEQREKVLVELVQAFSQAAEKFSVLAMPEGQAMAMGNQAYVLFLAGRTVEAEPILRRALELGGEKTYTGELEDAKIHPIKVIDDQFTALVERLWAEVKPKGEG